MTDFQAIADRVEIEALRGEFTDAAMMRDRARLAALFTDDGALRMPDVPVDLVGRDEIIAGGERLQAQWDFFVQNSHPGTIQLDGDTAAGRTYMQEIARTKNGFQGQNFAIYHDRYRRTGDGWKFAERVYEIRYLDTSPLAGSAPTTEPADQPADRPADQPADGFTGPASEAVLERAAAALRANNFTVEILDDVAAARVRVEELIPAGASVFTGASETLRLSGIDEDINAGGRYDAVKSRTLTMDRATSTREIWAMISSPDVIVGSVSAVTETGSLVVASASGAQVPGYAGGAGRAIWIVGAQKVVPDLSAALRRVEEHCLPLESVRAQAAYGRPSVVNRLLILNGELEPGRGTVLLLREAIGF
ncbi:nuclear transport factor 2 family protein [Dactylosporangium cerinum]|uniref:Nuclear transport factor 2 family protein n=1 Tax=Dactylosporangium cerinum TaxID=1434730 RepID=A0ABV9W0X3_9ACTN